MTFGAAVRQHHNIAQSYFDHHINLPKVQKLMYEADTADEKRRAELRETLYHWFDSDYKFRAERFGLKQLHFHLPDNTSFLRFHRPNLYGDNLTGIRNTIEFVNKNKKPVSTFEEGRIFNGYRFVFPISYEGHHVGSVETSVSINALTSIFLSHLKSPVLFVLKKSLVEGKVLKAEQKNYASSQISENYLRERIPSDEPTEVTIKAIQNGSLSLSEREKSLSNGEFFTIFSWINDSFYLACFYPLLNTLTKKHSGYIIVTRDHKEFVSLRNFLIYIALFLNILLLIIFFVLIRYQTALSKLSFKNELLEDLQSIAQIGIWEYDYKKDKVKWSHQIYEILGAEKTDSPAFHYFFKFIHPDDLEHFLNEYNHAIKTKQSYSIKHRIIRPNGQVRYLLEHGHMQFDKNGEIDLITGITKDVTELEEANKQLNEFINSQKDLTMLTNGETIDFANQAFLDFFGYETIAEFLEKHECICNLFVHQDGFFTLDKETHHPSEWIDAILTLPQQNRLVLLKDIYNTLHAFSITVGSFNQEKVVISFNDITPTIAEKQLLEDQVTHDKLTNAYSRQYLEQYLITVQSGLNRNKSYYLILFDIDHFKQVNDQYGHLEGDQLLKELVELTQQSIRHEDKLVRWGGEEFIVVGESKHVLDIEIFANHLRKQIENHAFKVKQRHITCSFGVTAFVKGEEFETTLTRADKALYEAKECGRNRVISR